MADVELHADFDRDGKLSATAAEQEARQQAPGAVVVANLDADRRTLPADVRDGPEITLDFAQPTKPAADDEVLPLQVRVANAAALAGQQLFLRFPGVHAVRMRVYDELGNLLPPADPGSPQERPFAVPAGKAQIDLRLEARALPGSPFGHATRLSLRFDPPADDEARFQIELVGRDDLGRERVHDRAHFSVAPVLFLDNGAKAVRLYICDLPDNQPSLIDVQGALAGVAGLTIVTVPAAVAHGDGWLQDQFQAGIVVGADRWRHLIVHLPRLRSNFVQTQQAQNLEKFVRSHLPARDVAVMHDFWQRRLVFADVTGRQVEIPFRECVALGERMQRVFALIALFDRVFSGLVRRTPPRRELSWSEARLELPRLLQALRHEIGHAASGAPEATKALLKDVQQDAETRMRHLEAALPVAGGGGSARFRLVAGRQTMQVGAADSDTLFARISQLAHSANYGGNIEVAPPTGDARLGTIVVGNTRIHGLEELMDPDLLRFLHLQRKQPVVQLDTSWLDVGHIDEVLAFVPNRRSAKPGFAALRASPGLAMALLRAAEKSHRASHSQLHPHGGPIDRPPEGTDRLMHDSTVPVTRLLRGKLWVHQHQPSQGPDSLPDVLEPPRIHQTLAAAVAPASLDGAPYWPGEGPDRVYSADITVRELLFCEQDQNQESVNDFIESEFLQPLHEEVAERFGAPVFPLPVLFDRVADVAAWGENQFRFTTSAYTPNVVNLQVVNDRLLVPRPYGPRMRPAHALPVLRQVLRELPAAAPLLPRLTLTFLQQPALTTTVVWIHRHDSIRRHGTSGRQVFAGLTTLDDVAKQFVDGFPGVPMAQVRQQIRTANLAHFDGELLRDGWRRFTINEGSVDLFEAVLRLVAEELKLTLRLVDSWFYHLHFGEIHCGTNVLRAPGSPPPRWWNVPDAAA